MRTIWKFKLIEGVDRFVMEMPKGARILSLQTQNGESCFWAMIPDTEAGWETRKFVLYGTGHPITEDNLQYIGTFQQPPYVFHLFEEAT
jgi:hypothetical protein